MNNINSFSSDESIKWNKSNFHSLVSKLRDDFLQEKIDQDRKTEELNRVRVKESCEVLEKPIWSLFLDDERFPVDEKMIIARTFDEAKSLTLTKGCPVYISFDHDLWLDKITNKIGKSWYDFAKWLVEEDIVSDIIPSNFTFYVHSMNPVGKKNIYDYLNCYLAFKKTKNVFIP